jgi:excinuclease UvrABC nuclease subunit
MKRDLLFIKDFRPIHGYDGEIRNLAEDDLSEISVKEGVYIIASPQTKLVYPKGVSKIIYIGKANSIRRRLKEHQTNLRNAISDQYDEWWYFDRYNYMKYHGAKVYYYLCKGNQESKNLESQMISSFYDKFGAMPVGNGARSFQCETKEDEQ